MIEALFWVGEIIMDIGKAGLLAWGFLNVVKSFVWVMDSVIYWHRKSQIHKGQIYAVESHKDNPFKDTITVHAEVIDYRDGFVLFQMEMKVESLPVDNFLMKFKVWYGPYADRDTRDN